jgi:uncharacterized membrane protein
MSRHSVEEPAAAVNNAERPQPEPVERTLLSRFPRLSGSDLILGSCTLAFLGCVLAWQYGRFVGGSYAFHDLTLISDFFSNALVHGRPFWITFYQETHLKTHFTPSLLLLVPLFGLFTSQFALIAISATAVYAGVFIASRDQHASLARAGLSSGWQWAFSALLFAAFAGNRYTLRIISAAHFEPIFVFPAALLFSCIRNGSGYGKLLLVLLLALGVRQDAGLFVFFMLLGSLMAPAAWGSFSKNKFIVSAAVCICYVVLVIKVVMPWFGNDGGTRFWHAWGTTWPEVFLAWASSPRRVWDAIASSSFSEFNAQLLYLPALSPAAWIINQLPGVLFYTADSVGKTHLYDYNSSFLLPGLMQCFAYAQLQAISLSGKLSPKSRRFEQLILAGIWSVFACAVANSWLLPREEHETLHFSSLTRTDVFVTSPVRELLKCSGVHSVASDFNSIVFAPLRLDRYLLPLASRADLIVVPRHISKRAPFYVRHKELVENLLRNGEHERAASANGSEVFLSREAARVCSDGHRSATSGDAAR